MVLYTCDLCNKTFKQKSHFMNHLKRKTSCISVKNRYPCKYCDKVFTRKDSLKRHQNKACKIIYPNPKSEFICTFCDKKLSSKFNLERHQENSCKIKKALDSNDITELKKLLCSAPTKKSSNVNGNNNNNTTNNNITNNTTTNNNITNNNITNNNITNNNTINVILPHGKENMDYITDEMWLKIIAKGFESIFDFIEILHFNEDHPENHNIYISNMRDKYALTYDGTRWNLVLANQAIDDMITNKTIILDNQFNKFENMLGPNTKKRYKKFSDYESEDDDSEYSNRIQGKITLLAYNKRDLVVKSRNILKSK